MISHRKSAERGYADHGWLKSFHTFSFAGYYDPNHIHFRTLRVLNEDVIAPGNGFPEHGHDNMEIITVVLEGELEHKDSMGNTERIIPGEIQVMSAGAGITHSEYNPSSTQPLHLMQIWIFPKHQNTQPGYRQANFSKNILPNTWTCFVSPDGKSGSLTIDQDVELYGLELTEGSSAGYELRARHHSFIHLIHGTVVVNGVLISTGDALMISNESFEVKAISDSKLLMFDLT
ncbi:pirin family protein [bacterium]|nr:pirin family protein [bacterium]